MKKVSKKASRKASSASNNLSFFKAIALGFTVVSIGISIAVGGYLLGLNKNKTQPYSQISTTPSVIPDPTTANWKTYANTAFNFSIQHPQGWTIDEGSVSYLSNEKVEKIPSQTIVFKDANSSTNISMIGNFQGGWGYGVTWTETIITSNSNVKITKYANPSSETVYYRIALPVNSLFTTATPAKQENLFDQILSTFKFTN